MSGSLFREIVELLPIPTVETVILDEKGKVLVVRRSNSPVKNEWRVPGGKSGKEKP